MLAMIFALRWTCVLGIALFLPVALPAGGSESSYEVLCRSEYPNNLFISDSSVLQVSPFTDAPSLRFLNLGTPLQVVRRWKAKDGTEWIYGQIVSTGSIEFSSFVRRGWLNVSNT